MTTYFYCENPNATDALAKRMAPLLKAGDVLLLHGEVGAGKSHFARALIRELLSTPEDIPSPTFTLVQTYEGQSGAIWHCDLYRLGDASEIGELGLDQAFEEAICLIEWPEKLGHATPLRRLDITLEQSVMDADARAIAIEATGAGWDWLDALAPDRPAALELFQREAGWDDAQRKTVAGDASNRRYDRLSRAGETAILMDAPPARNEDTRPFLEVGAYLLERGFSAPVTYAKDSANGFLLIEDFGDDLYARVIPETPDIETELYAAAIDLLVELQSEAAPEFLPPYSNAVYQREAHLLAEWYTDRLDVPAFRAALDAALARLSEGRAITVLRDYHAENLLWLPERDGVARVGLLDYQDALAGHGAYDLVSLLEDARRDVSEELRQKMIARFADATGQPLEVVQADCAILGAQRNAKIVGIFHRLAKRDGKAQYLDLVPRVIAHLKRDLTHPAVSELRAELMRALPEVFP